MAKSTRIDEPIGIGGRIAEVRNKLKKSREWLGNEVGVSASAVGLWETGTTAPTFANALKVAKALGLSEWWLAFGEGSPLRVVAGAPMPQVTLNTAAHVRFATSLMASGGNPDFLTRQLSASAAQGKDMDRKDVAKWVADLPPYMLEAIDYVARMTGESLSSAVADLRSEGTLKAAVTPPEAFEATESHSRADFASTADLQSLTQRHEDLIGAILRFVSDPTALASLVDSLQEQRGTLRAESS